MTLTSKQKKFLRAQAHALSPVVIIGKAGLTAGVRDEIDSALSHHELIKIRLTGGDNQERKKLTEEICDNTQSEAIQNIGRVAIIYRVAEKAVIKLP